MNIDQWVKLGNVVSSEGTCLWGVAEDPAPVMQALGPERRGGGREIVGPGRSAGKQPPLLDRLVSVFQHLKKFWTSIGFLRTFGPSAVCKVKNRLIVDFYAIYERSATNC
jgi:hypothetical protein